MTAACPYRLSLDELSGRLDESVAVTFEDLTSQFMLLPRGDAFLAYQEFLDAYETLRMTTNGFANLDVDGCWEAVRKNAVVLVVIRAIIGVSPPEWEDLAKEEVNTDFANNWTRALDVKVRRDPRYFHTRGGRSALTIRRATALFTAACKVVAEGAAEAPDGLVHRLDKIDTSEGLETVRHVSQNHVPYAVLLYERYLGRPFSSHRDSVSELVGDVMESAIEEHLSRSRIPFRKTKRAERVPGFDQAPDFFVPDEFAPSVIIEAKVTGDDGTARDKVSRILRLASMRDERERAGKAAFQVVACIDGRGFGVRRQDMKDLITATRGKVFTANRLEDLIQHTDLLRHRPAG